MSEGLLLTIVLCSFTYGCVSHGKEKPSYRHNDKDLVPGDSCSGGRVLAYRLVV